MGIARSKGVEKAAKCRHALCCGAPPRGLILTCVLSRSKPALSAAEGDRPKAVSKVEPTGAPNPVFRRSPGQNCALRVQRAAHL